MTKHISFKPNYLIPFFLFFFGCNDAPEDHQNTEEKTIKKILISTEQFDANNMTLAKLSTHRFEHVVDCNGYIVASPNGMANINTQISGIVKEIYVSAGDYVQKGRVLCQLTSNEFISLQKDFAESSAKLKKLKLDYDRSKSLYNEKIESAKNFMAAESDYKVMQAKYNALKLQLQLLNLNLNKIEKNEFYATYPLVAPINGQVSEIFINLGEYVQQQEDMMVLVNTNSLQIKISVFEEDIEHLKTGQTVNFRTVNKNSLVYTAVLKSIGKSINTKTKTINCLAQINKDQKNVFVNNSFVKLQIITDTKQAAALPNEAIIVTEDTSYVLSLIKKENGNYVFEKIKIQTGRKNKEYTEIMDNIRINKVLNKGAYNLQLE